MTQNIEIGDVCHIKKNRGGHWVGKVTEIHETIDDHTFQSPLIYVAGNSGSIPMFDYVVEPDMDCINGEWWER